MQYNSEVYTYQRVKKGDKECGNRKYLLNNIDTKVVLCFICAFLTSRVLMINDTAPFGIAFLICILFSQDVVNKLIAAAGTILGYVTLFNDMKNFYVYVIAAVTVTFFSLILKKLSRKKQAIIYFMLVFCVLAVTKVIYAGITVNVSVFTSCLEMLCIIPTYFIIDFSITCFQSISTKHLFSSEEIISMAITISIVIAGTWGITIYGISLRNIIAIFCTLTISYISGAAIGAASGVAMGAIVGMPSNSMPVYISIFGICGLVGGIFKCSGKWISGITFLITFSILFMYEKNIRVFNIMEQFVAGGIFYMIPGKILSKLEIELNFEKKQDSINGDYINKVKNMMVERLDNFSDVLFSMAGILNNLSDNDKLALKTKSSALVENLADRVCNSCNMKNICWKRELYFTYAAFEELISNYQDNKTIVPNEIDRKCIRRNALIKNTEEIVNNYVINEMWRIRLSEGREILSNQISNMANTVIEIQKEFSTGIRFNSSAEKSISNVLNKTEMQFSDIMCLNDKNDRLIVKVSMKACGGRQVCVKNILPLINEVTERCMCICDDGCKIDPVTNLCTVTFEETPKYHVATYVSRMSKEGEKENGDSYSFGKLIDGTYMVIVSDGMGAGADAGHESKAAIELIEKFTASGLSKITAINSVNSIMSLKFSEDEKFSTVDLCSIDLYSGNVKFMKVGAVASFIKHKNRVEIINSKTLPIGVLDKVDIEIKDKRVQDGDIILMVSDGIIDYDNENAGKFDWIVDYLKNSNSSNPKELVDGLVKKSIELGGGKAKDDMTAVVSKIYSLY